ncbi:response regulator transcription factor [Ferruginibacter sp.]
MTIVLIDDHILFIECLKNLLKQHGYSDVTIYSSAEIFIKEHSTQAPDIIIADLMMQGMNGLDFLEACRTIYQENAKRMILSSITDVQTIRQAIRAGALAYLSKRVSVEELLDAVNTVFSGKQYIEKALRLSLLNSIFSEEKIIFHLSPREKEVLNKVCGGSTIKEIAQVLHLSVHTVQYYHRCVMNKLKVKRTADLIVFAMQNGLYIPEVKSS